MKPYFFLIIASLLLVSSSIKAQNLSDKSNSLHLNFTGEGLPTSHSLPTIKWINPGMEYSSSVEAKISIQAAISSSKVIKKVTLNIGDDQSGEVLSSKLIKIEPHQKEVIINQSIWLPNGAVFLELEAADNHGATVSAQRKMTIGEGALKNMISMNRKDYALIFATDRYDHWSDLVNPIDDAHAMAKMLQENYQFEVEIVENASVEEVWSVLRSYNERNFNPQDQLLVFFAGHGHYDESFGEGYVVASNSLKNDVAKTTYISHNRLRGVIDNIPNEHILLAMDVCFGGTLDPVLARSRGLQSYTVSVSDMLIRKFDKRTRKYLTSGGKEYVSDGIPGSHSPFMSKLLYALSTNGGEDRVLTMSEIKSSMENLSQVPRFGSFGTDETLSDFVFIAK
ncbi:MAG: caspase family protein [Reichenbachiella sp.]|uniref:caspase family protein n=1 Tax=Reichenbachiella sp. TaxID=2184521 RepID=UPI003267706C